MEVCKQGTAGERSRFDDDNDDEKEEKREIRVVDRGLVVVRLETARRVRYGAGAGTRY